MLCQPYFTQGLNYVNTIVEKNTLAQELGSITRLFFFVKVWGLGTKFVLCIFLDIAKVTLFEVCTM